LQGKQSRHGLTMGCCDDNWGGHRDLYRQNRRWGHLTSVKQKNESGQGKDWEKEQVCMDPIGFVKVMGCPCLYFGANLARMYGRPTMHALGRDEMDHDCAPPPLIGGCADVHEMGLCMCECCDEYNPCCLCVPTQTLKWACFLCLDPCSIPFLKFTFRRDMYFKYGIKTFREESYGSSYRGACYACWPCFWPAAIMQCRQESAELDFHEGAAEDPTAALAAGSTVAPVDGEGEEKQAE